MTSTDAVPLPEADQAYRSAGSALRSTCPVAGALDLVGDRWTLLVIRDLLRGKRRYGDLAASAERIPTNILADRLRRLQQAGLVERRPYSERPPRYEYQLTPSGEALGPAVSSLATWGRRYIPGTRLPSERIGDVTAVGTPPEPREP
jgi:DNA-binding HxlR family transcriptional regulator